MGKYEPPPNFTMPQWRKLLARFHHFEVYVAGGAALIVGAALGRLIPVKTFVYVDPPRAAVAEATGLPPRNAVIPRAPAIEEASPAPEPRFVQPEPARAAYEQPPAPAQPRRPVVAYQPPPPPPPPAQPVIYQPDIYVESVHLSYNSCCTEIRGTVYNKGAGAGTGHILIRGYDSQGNEVEVGDCYTSPTEVESRGEAAFTWYFTGYKAVRIEAKALAK